MCRVQSDVKSQLVNTSCALFPCRAGVALLYCTHLSVSHAAAMHTALAADCMTATRGSLPPALLCHVFQHAPLEPAPSMVAWRLKLSVPKLGLALDVGEEGAARGSRDVLQVALRNAVVVLQDTAEVGPSRMLGNWVITVFFVVQDTYGSLLNSLHGSNDVD